MRLQNLASLGVSILGTCKFIRVCAHRSAVPELILSGLYRSVDRVSGLDGIAIRFIDGKRCAIIFLAGMAKQGFRYAVETEFINMESFTDRGRLSCYRLSQVNTVKALLKRTRWLARLSRGRLPDLSETMDLCVSGDRVVLKIGNSEFRMGKISDDPYHIVEQPLEPPDNGKYVNDSLVPGLKGLSLTIAENRKISVEIVLPDGTTQEYCRGVLREASTQSRCFEFVTANSKLRTNGLALGHFLMDLPKYEIQLCRDSKSATYLAFDKVKVRLKQESTGVHEPRTEPKRTDDPSGHRLAISGLYRTTGSVSVFNGLALRFAEGKCAIVFLAGMPEQDFRYSISTEFSRMQPSTTRGLTCYKLNNENVRDDLHRASTLQKKLGGPGNVSPETVFPCVLNGGVLMMAGGSTYPMRMVSGDPYKSLELPLQPPPPGVYVNDYPVAGLDSVTVAVDTDGSFSVKVAIIGRTEVTLLGRTFQSADPLQRCFRDVTPHVQSITILLAAKDSSTKLILDDVKLCRDSWLVTYIVLGDMSIRLKEFSHPENLANKIRLGMPPGEASTRSQVIGQDKPPISNPKPTGESIIREASQGNADSPDLGSLWPSSVTKRSSPGPRNGSPRTGDQNVQQLLPVRKEEASALNPEPKKKLIRLPVFSVSPSSAGETLPSGLARGGFPRASGDSAELRDQQKDTLKPKREPLAAVVSAPSGSLLHIDSLLPLPAPQRSPSGPGREGFPIVSGEAGKVRILRQGEPSALNDGSGTKSPLAEPGSSESGNLPELDVLLPPPVNSRSRVESVHAARPHKTVTGRSLGPAEDLQASMERGSLVKPSTHPQRPRSTALQSETDGARASKRQKTKHTASISHGLAERKPGKVRPHTENTGKHGGEKSDFGPTTSAIKARESASGGGHHGFGYSHKARFPTGAVGKPSGSSQVRSLRPGDEESNLETQLSIIDSEVPEWSTTPTETRGVGMVPDFGASLVPSNVTWSDLLSPEPGVSMTAPSGAGEERGELSIDEKLEMVRGGLLDFLDPDKQ